MKIWENKLACLIARVGSCSKTKRRSDINTWEMDEDIVSLMNDVCFPK